MRKLLSLIGLLVILIAFNLQAQISKDLVDVTVTIQCDEYGEETTWDIVNTVTSEVYGSGGPYSDSELVVETVSIEEGTQLTFTIYDSYGDGISGPFYGEGWYTVEAFGYIFATGGVFLYEESTSFVLIAPAINDAGLTSILLEPFVLAGDTEIAAVLKNFGVDTIISVDFSWRVDGGVTNTDNLTGLSLAINETLGVTHSVIWDAAIAGVYELEVWVSNPNGVEDENNDNDLLLKDICAHSESSQRLVLIEHFTQASCGPCAVQNPVLDSLIHAGDNFDKVAQVTYHTSWPGVDPMYNFNVADGLGDARVDYYGVNAVPKAIVAGNRFWDGPAFVTQDDIDKEFARPGLFNIDGLCSVQNDVLNIDIDLTSLATFSNGNLKVHTILVEDVEYATPPGNNGETIFPDVMRMMFPGEFGSSIALPTVGDEFNFNYTYEIDPEIIVENTRVFVFVQNDLDKDIYMSKLFELTCTFSLELTSNADTIFTSVSAGTEPYTYLWNTGSVDDKIIVTESGTYSVVVTDNLECTVEDSIDVVITDINSAANRKFKMYPNPAKDHVNINSESAIESITVYNFSGQVIFAEMINNTSYQINTSKLDAGIYHFQIDTKEGRIAKRIIIE